MTLKQDSLHISTQGRERIQKEYTEFTSAMEKVMTTPQEALKWSENLQARLIGFDENRSSARNLMGEAASLLKILSAQVSQMAAHSPNDSPTQPSAESDVREGFILAPKIPTLEMLKAGCENRKGPKIFQTYTASEVDEIYRDMMRAAEIAQSKQGGE